MAVTAATDEGFYLVSWCSGEARYRCPDEGRLCGGAGRNAGFVKHFVGDGRHVRVPSNWIACRVRDEPYRSPDPAENAAIEAGEPALTFRVYDFAMHRGKDDPPADGGAAIDVMLIHLDSGDLVLHEAYEPPYGPAVGMNVAERTGDYRLVATAGQDRTSHRFTLSGSEDPSLDGTCVYRGPDGDLEVVEVVPPGDRSVPEPVCWNRSRTHPTTAAGA